MHRTRRVATTGLAAATAAVVVMAAPAAAAVRERPMVLPGDRAQAAGIQRTGWLVAARPGATSEAVARRFGARGLRDGEAYRIREGRARAFAAALRARGLLLYAEPNVRLRRESLVEGGQDGWARGAVVPLTLAPPAPGVAIGIIDDFVDPGHPDVGPQTTYLNPGAGVQVLGPHGTEVASAAAAAANGSGVMGILPGTPIASYGMPTEFTCADVANGIDAQVQAGVRVLNLSLGGPDCFTMFRAVQGAYAAGRLVVAAAGNEFQAGNPVVFPAAYPHVLSVAAIRPDFQPAAFSSANLAIDVAAPGQAVPVAVPGAFDTQDGTPDGITLADGTSFASPIVAGAAAWLASARPTLTNGQVADILRTSAVDLPPAGYDRDTGFGVVNLPRALAAPVPRIDPLEPNDGITFVDGTAFGKPDPPVWRGYGTRSVRATADIAEDPVDVYRIRVPGRFAFHIRVRPTFGDPELTVFNSKARTISDTRNVLARSSQRGRHSETADLVNRATTARAAYIMVTIADSARQLNLGYRLELKRTRFPRKH